MTAALLLLLPGALALALPLPGPARAALLLPALFLAPGWGWARRLAPPDRLAHALDAAWLSFLHTHLAVALVRGLGLPPAPALLGLAAATALAGAAAARRAPAPPPLPALPRAAAAAVLLGLLAFAAHRRADLARPLGAHWWHPDATEPPQEPLDLGPAPGAPAPTPLGWPEAGAAQWAAPPPALSLAAGPAGAHGRLLLVGTGPTGATLTAGEATATITDSPAESADEGPVRRYRGHGAATLDLRVALPPGGAVTVTHTGLDTLTALPGSDAVWSAHAAGALRYVHYYQLLNMVENLDWAAEVLDWRWFTWAQPPGWSPLLAAATAASPAPGLPDGHPLFLFVAALVGLGGLRAVRALAPGAPAPALFLPAALALAHAHLLLEPGSTNFPDGLYAAAVVTLLASLHEPRRHAAAAFGLAAQALRWPGGVLAALFLGAARALAGLPTGRAAAGLALGLALGVGVAALAAATGHAEDLLFVLYFETIPEHYHDEVAPPVLLARVPDFLALLVRYTGGAVLVAALGAFGPANGPRRALWSALAPTAAYALLLGTIDHHPTHYFLPLVALSGPLAAAAAATLPRGGALLAALPLAGVAAFLWHGEV